MAKWILDAGHGGTDGGAVSSVKEKDLTLKITLYQYKRLQELGITALLTRASDVTLEPNDRTKKVNSLGGSKDYCISNHINAGGGTGIETIHSIHSKNTLAEKLCNAVVGASGLKKRRVFTRTGSNGKDYYFMHRQTKPQTIIVEYGFIDNKTDLKTIQDKWEAMAEAVVKVICEVEGVKYKAKAEAKKEEKKAEGFYRVQVGAFKSKTNAELLAKDLQKKGYVTTITQD